MRPTGPGPLDYVDKTKDAVPKLTQDQLKLLREKSSKSYIEKDFTDRFDITGIRGFREYNKDLQARNQKNSVGFKYVVDDVNKQNNPRPVMGTEERESNNLPVKKNTVSP